MSTVEMLSIHDRVQAVRTGRYLLTTVGRDPVILAISEMVFGNNSIDRVRWIVDRVERNVL
jgi:hypothetical protein